MLEKDIIDKIGDLPTLPSVATKINAEIQRESLTAKSLGLIIGEDTALTAKILRLANSAFYGQAKLVDSIDKAVMILGFDTIKSLAMSISIYSLFKKQRATDIDVEGLWWHSLGCAVAAKALLERSNKILGDQAFLYGVIHDIGKVVFIIALFKEFEQVLQYARENDTTANEAEIHILGFTHQKIGALLLKHWNFPEDIITVVKLHHDLDADLQKIAPQTANLVRAVAVGNQMAKAMSLGKSTDEKRQPIPDIVWKYLGIKRDDMVKMRDLIKEDYSKLIDAWKI
jgi:HD-like signal output (HDOD) protein